MNQDNKNPVQQIKKLPDSLINQIAAGEVVERPASVIKELIENSIDAGATKIIIELQKGGKDLIRVVDNGIGLAKDQFNLVFERHATSKIDSADALTHNSHLGFRGEALAAISSVSNIEFASNGYSVNQHGELKAKAMPQGTQVSVEQIFYNVPARQKFLKTDSTEYSKCLQTIESYVLCHPKIHFKLFHNQKLIFDYLPAQENLERVKSVYGTEFSDKLLSVFYGGTDVQITGFIGKPELARDKTYAQHFFVNGRPLEASYFAHAIKNAFGSLIFPSEKPPFLIWINLSPEDVDMNVHPRKLEARFHFQSIIYNLLLRVVKSTLEKTSLTKTAELSRPAVENFLSAANSTSSPSTVAAYSSQNYNHNYSQSNYNKPVSQPSLDSFTGISDSANSFYKQPSLVPLCQIANSYIVAEDATGVIFIDQHAAHERVMYQKLKKAKASQTLNTQKLLIPIQFELSHSQSEILTNAKPILNSIGFDISDFGGSSILINAIPAKFSQNDIKEVVLGLLDDLTEGVDFSKLEEIEDIVINYAACRGAIKFGQKLSIAEMEALISEMDAIEHLQYSCPHGRPSMINISFAELEKQFKRTK